MNEHGIKSDVCLGIVKTCTPLHRHDISACRDLGVPYRVLDIAGPNWMKVIRESGCDALLVTPADDMSAWKQLYDERLRIMTHELAQTTFPSYDEIWFCENKRRTFYWLEANHVAHLRTWAYTNRHEALAFADATCLPIVFKGECGSGATGIKVFHERRPLIRWIKQCFRTGWVKCAGDQSDRRCRSILLQAYSPHVTEWRVIRIGESYMGYQKVNCGDVSSGSKQFKVLRPPDTLLDFVRTVTERGGFRSMAVDVFETTDGQYLVNELQTTFGLHVENGLPMGEGEHGRMLFDEGTRTWLFEEGEFCQNNLCNLRVQTLLEQLDGSLAEKDGHTESDNLNEV